MKIAKYIEELVPYVPGKPVEETQRELGLGEVIKLASNENPLGPSRKAMDAIRQNVSVLHRYPDSNAFYLKEALSKHLGVDPKELLIGNGSNEVIELLIRTFCIKGDRILTSDAAFIAYQICAQAHGIESVKTPLDSEGRFDLPKMLEKIENNSNIRLVFIANPNNPTGTYVSSESLKDFVAEVYKIRGDECLVVIDSAYVEYVSAPDLEDPTLWVKLFSNLCVLRTFSKAYGLAGLRVGYGVSRPEVWKYVDRIREPFNINSLALVAAKAAIDDREFVKASYDLNIEGLKFWYGIFDDLKISYWKSQGNFLLVDFGSFMSGKECFEKCLKQGVIFRPVGAYGFPNSLRVSVGTMEENKKAAKVLIEVLN